MMDNLIIVKEDAFESLLNSEYYFQSLLQILHSNNLLKVSEIESIQLQLMNILTETVGYYTKNKSSSVRVETAEQIMLSVCYTLGLFLKKQTAVKENISLIREKELKYLFAAGEEILKAKVDECHRLLEVVRETRLKTENYAYLDTIDYAIPAFFKDYDGRFASHEIPAAIDYPLAVDVMNLAGVEYIEEYLNNVILENRFCSYFDASEIEAVLKGFNKNCDHMLINIFQLVLTNCIGCMLIGKGGASLDISERDRVYLKGMLGNLSPVELDKLIFKAAGELCEEFFVEDKNLAEYVNKTVSKIIPEIKRNIETNTLESIFITLSKSQNNVIKYIDGRSVENSRFRIITEEIRDCSNVDEKIEIIREEFHSLEDLVDVLSADCIFGDEFINVFEALDDFEIALLIKGISNDEVLETDYGTESEKEWHEKLKVYLEGLDAIKREEIIGISRGIEL